MMGLKILKIDDNLFGSKSKEEQAAYLKDAKNYATVPWKEKQDPKNAWATPFVTGHKYKIHFGKTGVDWDAIEFSMSERWEETDKSIFFNHNYTMSREKIIVHMNGDEMKNNTIPAKEADYATG